MDKYRKEKHRQVDTKGKIVVIERKKEIRWIDRYIEDSGDRQINR